VYETCEVCGAAIEREYFQSTSGAEPVSEWLGVCGCRNRKWRWRSATGKAPWELIGAFVHR
jgi:hypothetical protein